MSLLDDEEARVRDLAQRYPALQAFLEPLESYFAFFPRLKERLYRALASSGGELEESLLELQSKGVLPAIDPEDFESLIELWSSALFGIYLESIGFAPPKNTDVRNHLKEPIKDLDEFRARCERIEGLYGLMDHWESVLQKSCPEIYLLPFLAGHAQTGCDLACGWGRATLSLLACSATVSIKSCDYSTRSLQHLRDLAAVAGWGSRVETHACRIDQLPLADNSMDFVLAADIFELLPDPVLALVLDEILRISKPAAVLYFKVTLNAYQPTLGQVQNFTPRKVRALFEGRKVEGKSMALCFHDRRAAEHFTFQVTEGSTPPTALSLSSAARSPARTRAARLSKLRRR